MKILELIGIILLGLFFLYIIVAMIYSEYLWITRRIVRTGNPFRPSPEEIKNKKLL